MTKIKDSRQGGYAKVEDGYLLTKDIEKWIDGLTVYGAEEGQILMQDPETGARFMIKRVKND